MKSLELTKQVTIRSIHHLENPALSSDENKALYGPCYGEHGHHYKVQVSIRSELNETSGFIFDRDQLEEILTEKIIRPYDGVDLNTVFSNTACEALAMEFYRILAPSFPPGVLTRVGIQETRKNYFEYPPKERPA